MNSNQYIYENNNQFRQLLFDNNLCDSKSLLFQIFSGDPQINKTVELLELLNSLYPEATVIGSTSGKEAIGTSLNKGSIVVSVTSFDETKLASMSMSLKGDTLQTENALELGNQVGRFLKKHNAKVGICFISLLKEDFNCEIFLDEIFRLSPATYLAGGYSGIYHMHQPENYFVFHKNAIKSNSCVVAALTSDNLKVSNHFSMEWIPIGNPLEVTEVKENRIYSLDNRPTYDIYKKYLGKHIETDKKYAGLIFPLYAEKHGIDLVRIALHYHDDGSISYPANFAVGDKVYFGVANTSSFQDSIANSHRIISQQKPEAIFCYSCMARDSFLPQDRIREETQIIGKLAPYSGFQTMGEFYHSDKGNFFMNYSATFLLLSEGQEILSDSQETPEEEYEDIHQFEENFELKTLTHLLEVTSSQLKKSNQLFKKLAIYDALTQIYNRGKIERNLRKEIEKCKREMTKTFSLFLFDIDNFKQINDRFGHDQGDLVLKRLTNEVSANLRQVDYFGRWGGEEFMIILPQTILTEAKSMMDRILKKISEIQFEGDFSVTVSGGLVEYSAGLQFDDIMTSVDSKLYKAKRSGKNRVLY